MRPTRTLEQVMQEYANVCSELGDLLVHREMLLDKTTDAWLKAKRLLREAEAAKKVENG